MSNDVRLVRRHPRRRRPGVEMQLCVRSRTSATSLGVGNVCANCGFVYNPLQEDSGGDKIGDACDPD